MVGLAYEKVDANAWAAEDEGKETPLHFLMQSEQLTAEMVGLAYEKTGADAWGAEDRDKNTPLHWLMESEQLTADRSERRKWLCQGSRVHQRSQAVGTIHLRRV